MTDTNENTVKWYQDSILLKVGIIALIVLALLIPSAWIQSLVVERDNTHEQNMAQESSQWSASQLVQGPVLAVPFKKQVTETNASGQAITRTVTETAYVLPQTLKIKAAIKTEAFKQGIKDVTLYNAAALLQGTFLKPDLGKLGINPRDVLFDKAKIIFSLSDLKGLKNNPIVKIQGQEHPTDEVFDTDTPFGRGLQAGFALTQDSSVNFSYTLDLKGSNQFSFLQLGKETDVEITSDWASPKFIGHDMPDNSKVNDGGFTAKWHVRNYSRAFPQQWVGADSALTSRQARQEAVSGVEMRLSISQYHKVLRTTKYGTLIIVLTFVSLFFTELIRKQRIHLFNYMLVGAAMVVYYTLLLSFAEQIGYNYAYLIASVATISLIAIFTGSLLKNRNAAILFASILSLFYGFIYVIIQLEELSLMIGSIALFLVIAAMMYFSGKINWDKH